MRADDCRRTMSGHSSLHAHDDGSKGPSGHSSNIRGVFSLLPEHLSDIFLMLSVSRRLDFANRRMPYSVEDIRL